jgi:hypothetical protein
LRLATKRRIRPQIFRFVEPVRPVARKAAAGGHFDTCLARAGRLGSAGVFLSDFRDPSGIRPDSTVQDPAFDDLHLRLREFVVLLRRHGQAGVGAGHRDVEHTLLRLAGHDGVLLTVTTGEEPLRRPHVEPTLELLRVVPVAGEAFLLEERQYLQHEMLLSLRLRRQQGGGAPGDCRHRHQRPEVPVRSHRGNNQS